MSSSSYGNFSPCKRNVKGEVVDSRVKSYHTNKKKKVI